ncbi:MAG TPA: sulfatase [Opitutaceae bacterium]
MYPYRILSAVLVAAFAPQLVTAAGPERPNVLFIAVDDLRTNLGCYGDTAAITPNIDRLASQGARFTRAYCQEAVCNPSRQSLLTGRRPDTIRVWDLFTHFRKTSPGVTTLPEHFKANGYFAQSFGKIYHGEAPMSDPESWSVPEQLQYVPKRDDYRLPENRGKGKGPKAAAFEFADAPDDAYPDGQVAAGAVAAIERLAADPEGAPFFLAVGFMKPHLPFTAPRRYWDLYEAAPLPAPVQPQPPRGAPALALHDSTELRGYTDMPKQGDFAPAQIADLRRAYYAATSFTDAQIGRVLEALRKTNLQHNTLVVLWSDHGFHLGEHGLWAKTTNYEADTRVPLILVRPGQENGTVVTALVELLDLYPTLVELCGLPQPAGLEGRSLRPWLDDPAHASREAVFSQYPRPWPRRGTPDHMGYAVRTATHRYVEWRRFGTTEIVARELYRYEGEQLFETENLADDPREAARVAELQALLPAAVR